MFGDFTKQRMHSQEMGVSISPLGSLYVTGGDVGEGLDRRPSSHVDVVDVRSGETSRGPSMRHPRWGHVAAASPTSVFVLGGFKSCEVLNPQTRQ